MTRSYRWKAIAVGALLAGPVLCGSSRAQEAAGAPLATYRKLDASAVTVSGISSGAFFAHQFHVAFSGLVKGAGLVAGGPYGCADDADSIKPPNPFETALIPRRVVASLAVCTHFATDDFRRSGWRFPDKPNAHNSRTTATGEHAADEIDDPANLADSRVWIFHGRGDDVVPSSTVEELSKFYQLMRVPSDNIKVVEGADAQHGLPIDALAPGGSGRHCEQPEPSFLVKCDYGAAEMLLPHLLPGAAPPAAGAQAAGRIVAFDQSAFFDADDDSASLDRTGYLYVPPECTNDSPSPAPCRLHVAFHGCEQYAAKIHDTFVREAGYNAWADANRLIILYPQATQWLRPLADPAGFTANPKGCWDWWGYSGTSYLTRDGTQMKAVRAMIARLLGS